MTTDRHEAPRQPVVPPAPSTIDLHTHSTRSDGVLEPATLVADAAAVGVRLLALTDHDTLAGVREIDSAAAIPDGLALVPGVEINTISPLGASLAEGELHVLGLGVRTDDEAFEAVLARQRTGRRRRFERTVERLREIGLPVDAGAAELTSGPDDALGRPTIARLLVAAGHATSVQDAFARLIGHDGPGYVPRSGIGPTEAIAAIRAAGGLPVLAHFWEASERADVLRELMAAGLGGLEVYYRTWDAPTVLATREVAAALGLVATGGSDYHGDTGTYAEAHASLWVPPEVAAAIAT
ncbi:MAG TPA: PHP domain-containing protein [Candidatus Limnocylindrales bacterium]|nr:PHP domain-containing protein [Candidatus Limnocylindrales bacterium]